MRKWAFGILLAGLLPAASASTTPDFKATAHTIAIVSLLGDTLQVQSGEPIPVPGAAFDALTEQLMAGQIKADLPGAQVVKVGGTRDALFEQLYPKIGFGDVGMARLRQALKPWAATHTADYIVILRKTVGAMEWRSAAFTTSDHWTEFGIGLGRFSRPGRSST
ncbi:MAG: hypothetical protein WDM81_16240 [Rhizomicrobium sp.]